MWDQKINVSKKNVVLFFYVIILSLIGPIIFWISNKENNVIVKPTKIENANKPATISKKVVNPRRIDIQNRLSLGEKILVSADTNPSKQAGVMAIKNENYNDAHTQFLSSLQVKFNDPEALIYANNAIAALQKNELRIGVSVPIGGNLNVAKEILRGVAQAQHEVNHSGGINGRFIKVQIANDDNNPEIAKQIATEFVNDEKIVAVIGHNSSDISISTAPIYEQGGLVMISPTSSAKGLPDLGKYIFRTTPSTRKLADKLAEYVVDIANKDTVAICSDSQSEASQSFKEEFIYGLYEQGGKIARTKCDFSAPDFDPYQVASQAVSDGADSILVAPSISKLNKAIELTRANRGRLTLFGNHSVNTYSILKEAGQDVNGMVSVVAWYPEDNPQSYFAKNSIDLWGGSGNWRTATTYDASEALIASFKLNATSRQDIQATLANPYFVAEGASSDIKFMPSGDRNMEGTLIRVQPGNKSGTGYDFEKFEPRSRS